MKDMRDIYKQLVTEIKNFKKQTGLKRAVLGLSGGLDSAVVAVLAQQAFGNGNVFGIAMPSKYTSDLSNDTARELAGNLGINFTVKPIVSVFDVLSKELQQDFTGGLASLTEQNLQARIRGVILMSFANQLNAAALATGNKSEIYAGYCTLYGDTCGALAPIADLYKTQVFELARYINKSKEIIPWATIERAPSAELKPNQKDCDELPPYEILDAIIEEYVFKKSTAEKICKKLKADKAVVEKTIKRINANAFKRCQLPPAVKIK